MAIESATFFVEDYKGRHYKVHAMNDFDYLNGGDALFCMVYRSMGIDDSPEQRRLYEDEYFADFVLRSDDCDNLNDDIKIERAIMEKFQEPFWVYTWIDDSDYDENNECENQKAMDKELMKGILADYRSLDLESVPVEDALSELSRVSEKMSGILEKLLHDSK